MKPEDAIDDALIAKFLAGEATPEEAMLVSDWIDRSEENKAWFNQSQQAWLQHQPVTEARDYKSDAWKAIRQNISPAPAGKVVFFTPLRVAATILLLISVGTILYLLKPATPAQEAWITENSNEKILTLPLPEGTSIVLNRNSSLSYPKEFKGKTRTVKLEGEAFFDVTHQADQPFEVDYGEVTIKVLGTAFNVRDQKTSATIETQVIRGKVMMSHRDRSIIIEAGWTGEYNKKSKALSLRKSQSENRLGYATHTFTFEDASLKSVTDLLAESYGVVFVFENEKLKDCHLTSSYQNKSLSFILEVIAESLNLKYTWKENRVYLSGDGCS
jgi:ferric-dicitrate binding protein FerR (iron transport regulator)